MSFFDVIPMRRIKRYPHPDKVTDYPFMGGSGSTPPLSRGGYESYRKDELLILPFILSLIIG